MTMETANVTLRMEKGLKEDADRLLSLLGLSFSTAVNLFVRKDLQTQSVPFAVSTSGVGTGDGARLALLEELLASPEADGYIIVILFISTDDPKINVGRVRERHRNGSRDVPPEKVVARHERTMSLLPYYVRVADFLAAYDSGEDHERGDGEGPMPLLVKRGEDIAIAKQGRQSSWPMRHADQII